MASNLTTRSLGALMSGKEPLEVKIRKWLDGEGYPLEMRAAHAFRAVQLDVRQAVHYADADTGKTREIDLLCSLTDFPRGMLSLYLVVECKTSQKPWVVFSSEHTLEGYNRASTLAVISQSVRNELADLTLQLPSRLSWFAKDARRIGYSVAQAFTGNQEGPFSAAMATVKASLDLLKPEPSWNSPPLRAAFPVVVVDAPLYDCFVDQDGCLQLAEVEDHEFLFAPSLRVEGFYGTCIRVVTLRGLAGFCSAARAELDRLFEVLKPAAQREWEAMLRLTGPGRLTSQTEENGRGEK